MISEVHNSTDSQKTISGVLRHTFRHPVESLILRWNWKAAVLSALLRSPIFFTAYLAQKQGLWIAFGAMLAQFFFRTL